MSALYEVRQSISSCGGIVLPNYVDLSVIYVNLSDLDVDSSRNHEWKLLMNNIFFFKALGFAHSITDFWAAEIRVCPPTPTPSQTSLDGHGSPIFCYCSQWSTSLTPVLICCLCRLFHSISVLNYCKTMSAWPWSTVRPSFPLEIFCTGLSV